MQQPWGQSPSLDVVGRGWRFYLLWQPDESKEQCPQLRCPLAKEEGGTLGVSRKESPRNDSAAGNVVYWKCCLLRQGGEAHFIYWVLFVLALYMEDFWLMDRGIPKCQGWDGRGFLGQQEKSRITLNAWVPKGTALGCNGQSDHLKYWNGEWDTLFPLHWLPLNPYFLHLGDRLGDSRMLQRVPPPASQQQAGGI